MHAAEPRHFWSPHPYLEPLELVVVGLIVDKLEVRRAECTRHEHLVKVGAGCQASHSSPPSRRHRPPFPAHTCTASSLLPVRVALKPSLPPSLSHPQVLCEGPHTLPAAGEGGVEAFPADSQPTRHSEPGQRCVAVGDSLVLPGWRQGGGEGKGESRHTSDEQ